MPQTIRWVLWTVSDDAEFPRNGKQWMLSRRGRQVAEEEGSR